jgi:hypothetical protein
VGTLAPRVLAYVPGASKFLGVSIRLLEGGDRYRPKNRIIKHNIGARSLYNRNNLVAGIPKYNFGSLPLYLRVASKLTSYIDFGYGVYSTLSR